MPTGHCPGLEDEDDMTAPLPPPPVRVLDESGQPVLLDVQRYETYLRRTCAHYEDLTLVDQFVEKCLVISIPNSLTKSVYSPKELVENAADCASSFILSDPQYSYLGGRFLIESLQKKTPSSFSEAVKQLKYRKDGRGQYERMDPRFNARVERYAAELDAAIRPERDFMFQYLGARTLIDQYFLSSDAEVPLETPQYLFMRVAVCSSVDLPEILEAYDMLSRGLISVASPIYFNMGTLGGMGFSCYLMGMMDDTESIGSTSKRAIQCTKGAGGVGVGINIRAKGSLIRGTGGKSTSIAPKIRFMAEASKMLDQGGGKRKAAYAAYLQMWHLDIEEFLALRNPSTPAAEGAHDIFSGLMLPKLFMERAREGKKWTLFSPCDVPELDYLYMDDFEKAYVAAENNPNIRKRSVDPVELLRRHVAVSQLRSGTPYIVCRDWAWICCNQNNANIHPDVKKRYYLNCLNLCAEIVEVVGYDLIAVCNLASLPLPRYVDRATGEFDFVLFRKCARRAARMLNHFIDFSAYPNEEAKKSNMLFRPMGIGLMGLADSFSLLGLEFNSVDARMFSATVSEHLYFAAMSASNELAKEQCPYPLYKPVPDCDWATPCMVARGILHQDHFPANAFPEIAERHSRYPTLPWDELRKSIAADGIRNSLVVAQMPTASTSQIWGFSEACEAHVGHVYAKRNKHGEYTVINQTLVEILKAEGYWNEHTARLLVQDGGSVAKIPWLPDHLKRLFPTAFEVPPSTIIQMAAERGPWVDQSQSTNIYYPVPPTPEMICSAMMDGFLLGLKTLVYYTRYPANHTITSGGNEARESVVAEYYEQQNKEGGVPPKMRAVSDGGLMRSDSSLILSSLKRPIPDSPDSPPSAQGAKRIKTASPPVTPPEEPEATPAFCTREEGCIMCSS